VSEAHELVVGNAQGACAPPCVTTRASERARAFMSLGAGVFFYTPDDQRTCYAFETVKRRLAWFRDYLVMCRCRAWLLAGLLEWPGLSACARAVTTSTGAPSSRCVCVRPPDRASRGTGLRAWFTLFCVCTQVFDLKNKFIACTVALANRAAGAGAGPCACG
jgi:hypothetical protein